MSVVLRTPVEAVFIDRNPNRKIKENRMTDSNSCRVRNGSVYELQIDNDTNLDTDAVNYAFSLGSIMIETSGLIEKNDRVWIGSVRVGYVIGFANLNSSHPAIVISSDKRNPIFDLHSITNKRICFDSTFFIMMA